MSAKEKKSIFTSLVFWGVVAPVLVPIIIFIASRNGETPDFGMTVNPLSGTVGQGGVITTSITINSLYKYKQTVSLSASGLPPGVTITFAPPMGGPTPAYTSTVTLVVGSDAPLGNYEVNIKGLGADGKEHIVKYIMEILSSSSQADELPALPVGKIMSPKHGESAAFVTNVKGTCQGQIQAGYFLWLLIHPHPSPGQWWPQGGEIVPVRNNWSVEARFGREKEDVGTEFDVALVILDSQGNQSYREYLARGRSRNDYPGTPMPDNAKILDVISVVRK